MWIPLGSEQASLTVARQPDVTIEIEPIPQLTGDLFVHLVETFAVIGKDTASDFITKTETDFSEPVWVGQALACRGDDVGFAAFDESFRLLEIADATRDDDWSFVVGVADGAADFARCRDVAPKGSALI